MRLGSRLTPRSPRVFHLVRKAHQTSPPLSCHYTLHTQSSISSSIWPKTYQERGSTHSDSPPTWPESRVSRTTEERYRRCPRVDVGCRQSCIAKREVSQGISRVRGHHRGPLLTYTDGLDISSLTQMSKKRESSALDLNCLPITFIYINPTAANTKQHSNPSSHCPTLTHLRERRPLYPLIQSILRG